MSFVQTALPTALERQLILLAQCIFHIGGAVPAVAPHRALPGACFEEEAACGFTQVLAETDSGCTDHLPAPEGALRGCNLPVSATLRGGVGAVRADHAQQRDLNHGIATHLAARR